MTIKYTNFKYNLTTYFLIFVNLCYYGCVKPKKFIFPENHDYTKATVVQPLNGANTKVLLPRGTGRYDIPQIKSGDPAEPVDLSPPNYKDRSDTANALSDKNKS